jgi:hypothetical protein
MESTEKLIIRDPGKFEGCCRYVPHFWEVYLDGFADDDDGEILFFNVTADDVAKFPELTDRVTVRLMEDDQGFICEV